MPVYIGAVTLGSMMKGGSNNYVTPHPGLSSQWIADCLLLAIRFDNLPEHLMNLQWKLKICCRFEQVIQTSMGMQGARSNDLSCPVPPYPSCQLDSRPPNIHGK